MHVSRQVQHSIIIKKHLLSLALVPSIRCRGQLSGSALVAFSSHLSENNFVITLVNNLQ